jgi:hypothetical protein
MEDFGTIRADLKPNFEGAAKSHVIPLFKMSKTTVESPAGWRFRRIWGVADVSVWSLALQCPLDAFFSPVYSSFKLKTQNRKNHFAQQASLSSITRDI